MTPDALAVLGASTPRASEYHDFPVAGPTEPLCPGGWYARAKPVFDRILAVALLPPALVLIGVAAVVVKLTSAGPAFYTQTRVGHGGRRFTLVKLRTMRHGCEGTTGPCWSPPGDDRVTRVGRFLRATHLDELPQLWNVLRGDMSLVGPRPERPELIAALELERLVPEYASRLAVRPGVTGLAQLLLPPDTDVAGVRRKVAYDRYYIDHQGPWLDLRLLLGTLLKVFQVGPRALALPRPDVALDACDSRPGSADGCGRRGTGRLDNDPDEVWRAALVGVLATPRSITGRDRAEVRAWFRVTVVPALHALAVELRRHGRRAQVSLHHPEEAGIQVWDRMGKRELDLKFRVRTTPPDREPMPAS